MQQLYTIFNKQLFIYPQFTATIIYRIYKIKNIQDVYFADTIKIPAEFDFFLYIFKGIGKLTICCFIKWRLTCKYC
jgi:hypothetical protein